MKNRLISAVMIVSLLIMMLPGGMVIEDAYAQEKSYLALGDSISTGYGLLNPDAESFVNLLSEKMGYEDVTNAAINGNTAEGILMQLNSGELESAVKSSDLITITVGGNDLMHPLYERIAAAYNELYKLENEAPLEGEKLTEFVKTTPSMIAILYLMDSTKLVLQGPEYAGFAELDGETIEKVFGNDVKGYIESEYFAEYLQLFRENLQNVLKILTKKNPKAVIAVSTQYNPYVFFNEANAVPSDAIILNQCIGEGAMVLNDIIKSVIGEIGSNKIYLAEGVHEAFDLSDINLCNAAVVGTSIELDFHPNAEGHAVMANIMYELLTNGTPVIEGEEYRQVLSEKLKSVKPKAKSSLEKSNGKYTVKLSWTVSKNVKLDGYEVFRSTKKSSGYGTKPYYETKKTSYSNSSVKKGKTYYYKVRGYVEFADERLYTDWSNKASRKIK